MDMEHEVDGGERIGQIHARMESDPHYPFDLRSGWLPGADSESLAIFIRMVLEAEPTEYAPCIRRLDDFIEKNEVVRYLVESACKENRNIMESGLPDVSKDRVPRIKDKKVLLDGFNTLLKQAPVFIDYDLVGLPFSAFIVGIDPTLSGTALLRLPQFNAIMSEILDEWHRYLGSPESGEECFGVDGENWLSAAAKKQYDFPVWKKDNPAPPYWNSWNSFFTREFFRPNEMRPIADPGHNRTVISANDGSLFRWDDDLAKSDVYWFKDMGYSLSDILSSPDEEQQRVIDEHGLVEMFEGGYIFQTYLNPYNFHRWWVPVDGHVLFDPLVIPGCFFSKLVIPDFGGATTASTPYLAQVNARGLIVFKTKDYGNVCCIPLGMSEVSSIDFDRSMCQGAKVSKGQEMGMFNYGGSSFVMLFQKLEGKELVFENAEGKKYEKRPVLPKGSAGTGGNVTNIGAQIGVWRDLG